MDQRFLRLYGEVPVTDLSLCRYSLVAKLCETINRQRHTPHLDSFQTAVRRLLWRILPDYGETPHAIVSVQTMHGCPMDERAIWSDWLQASTTSTTETAIQRRKETASKYHFDVCLRM